MRNRQLSTITLAGLLCGGCPDQTEPGDGTGSTGDTTATAGPTSLASNPDTTDTGDTTTTTGTDDSTSTGEAQTALDQAIDAIGGEEALTGLELLQISSDGSRRVDYEAPRPDGLMDVSSYSASYMFDLPNENFRLDSERQLLFEALQFSPVETFSIVLNGRVGGLDTQAGFTPPGAMPSQHVAALITQQRLFNPHLYLREAIADPSLAADSGTADFEGRPHRIITFAGAVTEMLLYVDEESGFISKLETLENHPLARDVAIEVRYIDWQSQGSLAFPNTVELYAGGGLVQEETRSAVEIEPEFAADDFDLPPEVVDPVLDDEAFAFGQQSHQALEGFFNLAFYVDTEPPFMTTQLAPGVTLLAGPASTLVVSYDQGLVVLEAPASPAHGTNIVDALGSTFPGLDITHVIQSHHHQDHASGVRSLVAAGATAVVGNGVGEFWDGILTAESTIRPDALASAGVAPMIEEVPEDGTFTISDANVTITAHHMSANPHAEDMIFTMVDIGGARFVYEADLYASLVIGGPQAFFAALRDKGIIDASCVSAVPLTIVSAHGPPQTLAESLTALADQGIDVGC